MTDVKNKQQNAFFVTSRDDDCELCRKNTKPANFAAIVVFFIPA